MLIFISGCETGGGTRQQSTLEELDRWRAIADSAYAKKQYKRALNHYSKISAAVPQDAEVRFRIANANNRLGNAQAALAAYKEVLVRDNTFSKAWYNSSMIQLKIAAQAFQEATQHLKSNDPVYIASMNAAEELLQLIDESNAMVANGYTLHKKQVLHPDDVEVIILKQSSDETVEVDENISLKQSKVLKAREKTDSAENAE